MAKIPSPKKEKAKKEKVKKEKQKKPKKEKIKKEKKEKEKKIKKKKSKVQIAITAILLIVLAGLFFLLFGGDLVPKQIQNMKGYSYISGISETAKEKMPGNIGIPIELPLKMPDLSFHIPNPVAKIIGDKEPPNEEKIKADLTESLGEKESKPTVESIEIEKRKAGGDKEVIYVIAEMKEKEKTSQGFYKLHYKQGFLGGWKLETVQPYNVEGQKTSVAGVKNSVVVGDDSLTTDLPSDWKISNVKVIEHYTDVKAGKDTVIVQMEMSNNYVKMIGTKEVTYQYNEHSKKWEMAGQPSKLSCTHMEPI